MGNRAVVTFANKADIEKFLVGNGEELKGFTDANQNRVGVYLHWNGGRDSIVNFIEVCRRMKFRGPVSDCYGVARFIQTVANFFGRDGLSIGVDTLHNLDCNNWDNGVFVVDDGWNIIGREYAPEGCEEGNEMPDERFVNHIMALFPKED